VPRPVLIPVKIEQPLSKIEVKTESPIDNSEGGKTEIKLESEDSGADKNLPVPEYVVCPSKGLTVVFKNRASPAPRSPSSHATAYKSLTDNVMDVRVKLERCDDDELTTTPSKRARLETNKNCVTNMLSRSIPRCLELNASGNTSEDDAAVASLLGCAVQDSGFNLGRLDDNEGSMSEQIIDDNLSDEEDVEADSYIDCEQESLFMHSGRKDDEHVGLFADCDMSPTYQGEQGFFSGYEESVDASAEPFESYTEQMQTDNQLMSAVGTLMADLGQLNEDAESLASSQHVIVEQYSTAVSRMSGNGLSTEMPSHMQYAVNSIIGFHPTSRNSAVPSPSSCYDRTRISTSGTEHDSDLDAAVQSILT